MSDLFNMYIETVGRDKRVLQSFINDNTECRYQAEFYLHDCKDDKPVQNVVVEPNTNFQNRMISYQFDLERGLYDVWITRIEKIDVDNNIHLLDETRHKYEYPVMVGEKYELAIHKTACRCYGEDGVHILIRSRDKEINSHDIYYKITKSNEEYDRVKNIRYFIPFNNRREIDFFVKGVGVNEVDVVVDNPSFEVKNI